MNTYALNGREFTGLQVIAAVEAELADVTRWQDTADGDWTEEQRERFRASRLEQAAAGKLEALKRFLMPNAFAVLAHRVDEAVHELEKLARKAERYGTPPVKWELGPVRTERRWLGGERYAKVQVRDLIFDSLEAPRVGQYKFIARLERTPGGTIIDCVPGEALPERYRHSDGSCEHCRVNRERKDLFVVRGEEGELVQVGRTCLRDFLGTDTPGSVAARFNFIAQLREWDEEFCGRGKALPDSAAELLAVTSACIRLWGWVPKSAPESAGEPTAYRLGNLWFNPPRDPSEGQRREMRQLSEAVCDDDWALADRVMAWVADEAASGTGDFMWNLRTILATGLVEAKRRGYAAAAVAAYQRHLGQLEERRREAEKAADSQWLGRPGERLRGLKLTVVSARGFEGNYGYTILYKFRDAAGNVLTWFSSGGQELSVGQEVALDATVKEHAEYNGVRETRLTRGKVL